MAEKKFHGTNEKHFEEFPPEEVSFIHWITDPFSALEYALESARKFNSKPIIVAHIGKGKIKFELVDETMGLLNKPAKVYKVNKSVDPKDDNIEIFSEDRLGDFINKFLPNEKERALAFWEHNKKLRKEK